MSSPVKLSILSISADLANGPGVVHPVVLHDDKNAILIDCGLPGMADQIVSGMEAAGVSLKRLTHVVITHSDMDHIGSLARLLAMAPQTLEVFCHEQEKPYIECDVPPLRLAQMEGSLHMLTGERLEQMTGLVQSLKANYKNLKADVTKTVDDGEMLPCGAEVVWTPGHTPGHICLYLKDSRTLIAGDALNVTNSLLLPAPERLSFDMEMSRASMIKLTGYDIETVVCYHGGLYNENVNQRIKEITGN